MKKVLIILLVLLAFAATGCIWDNEITVEITDYGYTVIPISH